MARTALPDGKRERLTVSLSEAKKTAAEEAAAQAGIPPAIWLERLIDAALGWEAEVRACPGCGGVLARRGKYCTDRCGDTARHAARRMTREILAEPGALEEIRESGEAAERGDVIRGPEAVAALRPRTPSPAQDDGSEEKEARGERTEPPASDPAAVRKAPERPPAVSNPTPPSSKPQVTPRPAPKSAARAKAVEAAARSLGPGERARALRGLRRITARDVSAVTGQAPGAAVFMSYDPADGDPYTTGAVPPPADGERKKGLPPGTRRPVRTGRQ